MHVWPSVNSEEFHPKGGSCDGRVGATCGRGGGGGDGDRDGDDVGVVRSGTPFLLRDLEESKKKTKVQDNLK